MARKMKDSGIEWIGEIPEGWEVVPVKRLCTMQAGKNLTSEQIAPEGTYPVYGGNGIRGFFSDYNCDGQFLTVGRQGALCGNVHKINGKVWATEHAVITTPSSYTILDFLYYLLIGMDLNQYVSSTAAQPGLAVGTLLNLKTCYPCSTLEQTQISNYLNAKCSEIDIMLTKTRSSIEEYKKLKQAVITLAVTKGVRGEREMKDSGVEWIGKVPSKWNCIKIKYLFEIRKRIAGKEGYTVLSITQTGIKPKNISSNEGQLADSYSNYQLLHFGEFAMNHMDLLTGWVDISNYNGVTSPDYRVFSLKDTITNHPRYFLYLMQMCYFNRIFYSMAQGVSSLGRWRLQSDKFLNCIFPVPSIEEQKEISAYLDTTCSEIDKLIAKKEQLVKELESYKKSLIYEVVTGKREV